MLKLPKDINIADEIRSLRTEKQKVFEAGNKKRRYIITTAPIHYWTEAGQGENIKIAEYDDIDVRLKQEIIPDKEYYSQYIASKNLVSVGFRNDRELNKINGIRLDEDHQIEMSLLKIELDGKEIKLPEKFLSIDKINDYQIEHKITDDITLWHKVDSCFVKDAIKTTRWVKDFKIKQKIDFKGFEIENKLEDGEYIANERNEFVFKGKEKKIWIPNPQMWNDENSSNEINHRLYLENGSLYYEKTPTEKGKDWLATNSPTFYIDGTAYYSSTEDGLVELSAADNTWAATHGAETGTTCVKNTSKEYYATQVNGNKTTKIDRSFFYYNTSGIDDGYTVAACDQCFYSYPSGYGEIEGIYAQQGTQADTLTTADYDAFSGSSFGYQGTIPTINNIFKISYNSAGRSAINKTGTTKICVRNAHDYDNSDPVDAQYSCGIYFTEYSTYKPYLDITAEESAGTLNNIKSINGLAIASIKEINGLAKASTKSYNGVT